MLPAMRAMCRTDGEWKDVDDLDDLSDLCLDTNNLVWAEVDTAQMPDGLLEVLTEEFSLHPLAVEDALNGRQRPKLERYPGHLFLVLQQLDEVEGQLEPSQIACFVGPNWVFALHTGATATMAESHRRWGSTEIDFLDGSMALLHTILDVTVDGYQNIGDRLEARIEDLEDIALDTFNPPLQKQIYQAKQQLARMRRYALPAGRALEDLMAADASMTKEARHYFGDISDHMSRINQQVGQLDDLLQAVLDLVRGEQAQALNEVTKKLTSWAAIIAVPTFIASVYGMNVHLLPDGNGIINFFVILLGMFGTAAYLYFTFKKKGWL